MTRLAMILGSLAIAACFVTMPAAAAQAAKGWSKTSAVSVSSARLKRFYSVRLVGIQF